jgi:septal ring factor EnvC (AmiA/AmiB activator)
MAETMDVRRFALSVVEAGKAKQLPNYVLQGPKGSSSLGGKKSGGPGNAMAGYDAEKKYKKNLEALKQEIEEKNREVDGLGAQIQDCHDRYNKLDREKKDLEARLVDKNSKPPRETANQSLAFSQAQELMQLRD